MHWRTISDLLYVVASYVHLHITNPFVELPFINKLIYLLTYTVY